LVDREKVKQWASAFSEGTTIETNWSIGSEVIWKDGEGNIGAKGIVQLFDPRKNYMSVIMTMLMLNLVLL
jgi:hypothetical protein